MLIRSLPARTWVVDQDDLALVGAGGVGAGARAVNHHAVDGFDAGETDVERRAVGCVAGRRHDHRPRPPVAQVWRREDLDAVVQRRLAARDQHLRTQSNGRWQVEDLVQSKGGVV
jgi:hypothetical protein